ncbi:MAG: hypothetical protein SGJ18_16410 [Pseudomonadota bacterium]|nr:hypothetical protein [Pseudomonadota bacterium]
MKTLIVLLAMGLSLSVHAARNSKFSCGNVGGTDEWTVYVDLDKKLAGFFDNDSTVTIPLVSVRSLESNPPQLEYTFAGLDTSGEVSEKMQITFNSTMMSASVTFNLGTRKVTTEESLDGCVVDNLVDL